MALNVELAVTRGALAPQGGATHVRVTVVPPAEDASTSRAPVAMALVVDRSGSMDEPAGAPGGTVSVAGAPQLAHGPAIRHMPSRGERRSKMSVTRDAAERLVDAMRDGDRLAIISFSDVAQLDLPLTDLGGQTRTTARHAIRGLRPDAMTNLHDGLRLAVEQFDETTRRSHVCKLLVMTDGQANVGVTSVDGLASLVQPAASTGIMVSAIGVGLEYNSAVLAAIGRAGGGEYYHIESASGVDALLQRELDAASAVSVRGVEVRLAAGPAAIGANLNGYTQTQTAEGVRVLLGDLARPRAFWVELSTPVAVSGDVTLEVSAIGMARDDVPEEGRAELRLKVTPDAASVPEDAALVQELADLIRALGIGEAAELYDSGDLVAGQQVAQRSLSSLQTLGGMYGITAAASPELQNLAAAPQRPASAEDRRRLKKLAASSYAKRRGRAEEEDGAGGPEVA